MAISKTYSTGIYIVENGIYEVWHNGRYIARVSTPEEAEVLKQIAKENSERGNPLAGVMAARGYHKQGKIRARVEKQREKVGRTRKNLTSNDLDDLAKWLYENYGELPQIFSKKSTQGALEIKYGDLERENLDYDSF